MPPPSFSFFVEVQVPTADQHHIVGSKVEVMVLSCCHLNMDFYVYISQDNKRLCPGAKGTTPKRVIGSLFINTVSETEVTWRCMK
jgi:hypothetical protein